VTTVPSGGNRQISRNPACASAARTAASHRAAATEGPTFAASLTSTGNWCRAAAAVAAAASVAAPAAACSTSRCGTPATIPGAGCSAGCSGRGCGTAKAAWRQNSMHASVAATRWAVAGSACRSGSRTATMNGRPCIPFKRTTVCQLLQECVDPSGCGHCCSQGARDAHGLQPRPRDGVPADAHVGARGLDESADGRSIRPNDETRA